MSRQSSTASVRLPPNSPFAEAIENFVKHITEYDPKSPFAQAIKTLQEDLQNDEATELDSQKYADELLSVFNGIAKQRESSSSMKVMDKAAPFVTALTSLARFCEGQLQASPLAVGIVFAGARVLLNTVGQVTEKLRAVLDALELLSDYVGCYVAFFEAYPDDQPLRQALVRSYIHILKFWHEASKLLSQNTVKSFAKDLVKPSQIKDCLSTIEKDLPLVQVQLQRARLRHENRRAILAWILAGTKASDLGGARGGAKLEERLSLHQPGTSSWLFQNSVYKSWQGSKNSSVIWYHAPPGCGKTMLASRVVDQLRQDGHRVVYFLCAFDNPLERDPLNVFRSIALQLTKFIFPELPDKVVRLFEDEQANLSDHLVHPVILADVVHELLSVISSVYVIIDGLDESLAAAGFPILGILQDLISRAPKRHGIAKWFLTSRKEGPIEEVMRMLNSAELTPSPDNLIADVNIYLTERLKDSSSSSYTAAQLSNDTEGNFLVAKLKADTVLNPKFTPEDVEEELRTFPRGLTECYLRSLHTLEKCPERQKELARRVILMLIMTVQPLHLFELLDALAVRPGREDYSADAVARPEVLQDLLGSFLHFDHSTLGGDINPIVKLNHKSVQDLFLEDPEKLGVPAHARRYFVSKDAAGLEMGRTCLAYLRYKRYRDIDNVPQNLDGSKEHAFLRYAAVFWFVHLNGCRHPDTELRKQVRTFVQSPEFWTCVAVQSRVAPFRFARYRNIRGGNFAPMSGGANWSIYDSVSSVIPRWMDDISDEDHEASCKIIQAFHAFVLEWYEALTSGLDVVRYLPIEPSGARCFPGRAAKLLEHGIARKNICKDFTMDAGTYRISVDEVFAIKGAFKVRLFISQTQETHPQSVTWRVAAPFSSKEDPTGSLPVLFPDEPLVLGHFDTGPISSPGSGCYALSLKSLDIKMSTPKGLKYIKVPTNTTVCSVCCWRVLSQITRRDGSKSTGGRAVAYHLVYETACRQNTWTVKKPIDKEPMSEVEDNKDEEVFDEDEEESDEESEEEEESDDEKANEMEDSQNDRDDDDGTTSDSDSSSGWDSDGSDGSSTAGSSVQENNSVRYALVLINEEGKPSWIMEEIPTSTPRMQVTGAFHPTKPLYVWTCNAHELRMTNITTGKTKTRVFPEPSFLEPAATLSDTTHIREFFFSSDGLILHSLLAVFQPESPGSTTMTVKLGLSSFEVQTDSADPEGSQMELGTQFCPSREVLYRFRKRHEEDLSHPPFATTHWSDNALCVLLPLLTCSVKVLRFHLFKSKDKDFQAGIQTLTKPIYIPCSAYLRSPRLWYQPARNSSRSSARSADTDNLYLVLGPEPALNHKEEIQQSATAKDTTKPTCRPLQSQAGTQQQQPTVIRWSVNSSATSKPSDDGTIRGWRTWDAEQDECSDEVRLNKDVSEYRVLRGSFAVADKKIGVPIRGALDFRRKMFLSCA